MIVAQLIKNLEKQHPAIAVVIRGYEDGYNMVSKLLTHQLKIYPEKADYYGEIIDVEKKEQNSFKAIEFWGINKVF